MSRPIGLPKTGGRKKGTLNKKTKDLSDVFNNTGFDLTDSIIKLLPELDPNKRVDVLIKLMEYLYVKPKIVAVEVNDENYLHSELMKHIEASHPRERLA